MLLEHSLQSWKAERTKRASLNSRLPKGCCPKFANSASTICCGITERANTQGVLLPHSRTSRTWKACSASRFSNDNSFWWGVMVCWPNRVSENWWHKDWTRSVSEPVSNSQFFKYASGMLIVFGACQSTDSPTGKPPAKLTGYAYLKQWVCVCLPFSLNVNALLCSTIPLWYWFCLNASTFAVVCLLHVLLH